MTSTILSLLTPGAAAEFHRRGDWEDRTIYGVMRDQAVAQPNANAISDRGRTLTYAQLQAAADALAADLYARGVRAGQRVAYWLPDRVESAITVLACSRNGYVVCPSPHRNHTVAEVAGLLERMRAAAFIYQEGFGSDADKADIAAEIASMGSLKHVYRMGAVDEAAPFAGALLDSPGDSPPPIEDPDRVSYLAFTSGSTGRPKGVMHSDNTQLVTARGISTDWKIGPGSVVYSMSPFSHNLGMGALLTSLYGGASFVVHDRVRGESTIERVLAVDATYLVGVPTHAIDLLDEMEARGMDRLGKVTGFRISGAAAPRTVFERLIAAGVDPQSGYGMTETNGHQYTRPGDDPEIIMGSCGRVVPGYDIQVFDPDDPDRMLPQGEIGIVAGKGACLMLGYYDDQGATEICFNSDGWFMTGDLGVVDEAGYLRLTGRRKEVIIRGGHNINPERIEELAMRHVAIERAAALPVPDDRLGERVCLAVMFRNGDSPGFEAVLDHLAAQGLSRYDMPEFALTLDDIPLMSNGKIQKKDIMGWIRDGSAVPEPIRYVPPEKAS
jgi:acyl-CoA synthetase (AMP-forming)/AMP-acid ligase II